MEPVHHIHELGREQCIRLLRVAQVGRVVFTDSALPAVLPVAYTLDRDSLVIRTAHDSRLARAARGSVLAFEVDDVRGGFSDAWSVVVTGEAQVEDDPDERRRLDPLLRSWAPGEKDAFIRIPLTVVTGREVSGRPEAAWPSRRSPTAAG